MTRGERERLKQEINVQHDFNNTVLTHPKFFGSFYFDATTGLARVNQNQQKIWGFETSIVPLDVVLRNVWSKQLDEFQDFIYKSEKLTRTSVIQLNNGNTIEELFVKIYHPDDYECRSLIGMRGRTQIVEPAA